MFYASIVHVFSISMHFLRAPKLNDSNDLGPESAGIQIRASFPPKSPVAASHKTYPLYRLLTKITTTTHNQMALYEGGCWVLQALPF